MAKGKKVPQLSWNKEQLIVAKNLLAGKSIEQIQTEYHYTYAFCYKVKRALDEGQQPPDLSDEAIANAPPSAGFGVFPTMNIPKPKKEDEPKTTEYTYSEETKADTPSNLEAVAEAIQIENDGKKVKEKTKKLKAVVNPNAGVSQTMLLQLIPQVQQLPLTPEIFMSYMCAIKKGYTGTMAEWLSIVSLDFWTGRNINPFAEVSGFNDLFTSRGATIEEKEEVSDGVSS